MQSCVPNSFQFLDVDMIGLHMVLAYSNRRRVKALNVGMISSFCLPNLVKVSALKILSVFLD